MNGASSSRCSAARQRSFSVCSGSACSRQYHLCVFVLQAPEAEVKEVLGAIALAMNVGGALVLVPRRSGDGILRAVGCSAATAPSATLLSWSRLRWWPGRESVARPDRADGDRGAIPPFRPATPTPTCASAPGTEEALTH